MYFRNGTPHPGSVPGINALEVLDAYFAWRRSPEGTGWAEIDNVYRSDAR